MKKLICLFKGHNFKALNYEKADIVHREYVEYKCKCKRCGKIKYVKVSHSSIIDYYVDDAVLNILFNEWKPVYKPKE